VRCDEDRRLATKGRLRTALIAGLIMISASSASADGVGDYARGDYQRAARTLVVEADRGRPLAQTYLGFMYQMGRGLPQNFELAAFWYRRAAEQGVPAAQYLLAMLYDKGFGVPQDWVEAEIWLDLAAAAAGSARDRNFWSTMRDNVAMKLTLDERALAQQRAALWRPGFAP
jgi:TPR repeat protein